MAKRKWKKTANGFALSGMVYPILILLIFLVVQLLVMLGSRKTVLDKNQNAVLDSINNNKKRVTAAMVLRDKAVSGNTDGLIIDDTAHKNIRYAGSNSVVKNYVTFNNEKWRIIGVFNGKLKIMRNDSIGNRVWDTKGTNGLTNWPSSDLKTYLNETYLNSISSTSRNMVVDETYYLGGRNSYELTKQTSYTSERGTSVFTGCSVGTNGETSSTCPRAKTWNGKVGLMYPSDYGYAASSACNTTLNQYNTSVCSSNNWMFNSNYQWSITSHTANASTVICVSSTGSMYCGLKPTATRGVRPTLYLNPNVMFAGGNGTETWPYQLSL